MALHIRNSLAEADSASASPSFDADHPDVDMDNVRKVGELGADYAECRSNRNLNHELRSRFTGEVVEVDYGDIHPTARGMKYTRNPYYPSAEMHDDAVASLLPAIGRLGYCAGA